MGGVAVEARCRRERVRGERERERQRERDREREKREREREREKKEREREKRERERQRERERNISIDDNIYLFICFLSLPLSLFLLLPPSLSLSLSLSLSRQAPSFPAGSADSSHYPNRSGLAFAHTAPSLCIPLSLPPLTARRRPRTRAVNTNTGIMHYPPASDAGVLRDAGRAEGARPRVDVQSACGATRITLIALIKSMFKARVVQP